MQHLVLYTVCLYCNIHEFTCTSSTTCTGVHKHIILLYKINIHTDPKQPQWWASPASWGIKNFCHEKVNVIIYIIIKQTWCNEGST